MKLHLKRKAATVVTLVAAGVIAGPFDTFSDLSILARFAYWTLTIVGVGFFMNLAIYVTLSQARWQGIARPLRIAGAVLVAAVPSAALMLAIEAVFRHYAPSFHFAMYLWGMTSAIGMLVSLMEYRTFRFTPTTPEPSKSRDRTRTDIEETGRETDLSDPLFIRNLKPELGNRLVSLSIQDHYLEVVTKAGRDRILKRMADAVAELDGFPGMQIHRSHWVAFDAIDRLDRDGRKVEVVLIDGRRLPVSRPNTSPLLKAVGMPDPD